MLGSRTVATSALAVRRSKHSARSYLYLLSGRSYPISTRSNLLLARSHPHSARSNPHSSILIHPRVDRLDLIYSWLDLIHTRLDLIQTLLDFIHTRLDLIHKHVHFLTVAPAIIKGSHQRVSDTRFLRAIFSGTKFLSVPGYRAFIIRISFKNSQRSTDIYIFSFVNETDDRQCR